jgi:hypothetical protein
MNEMVERVARALVGYALGAFEAPFRNDEGRPLSPPFTPNARCLEAARATLEEMRKPTKEMRDAVRPYLSDELGNPVPDDDCDLLIKVIIDAAVGDGQDG